MAEWYLATYQNSVFSNDLGIIQPSGDYIYKLKNGIQSTESPVKSDWLRIGITDKTVKEWLTDSSSWTPVGEGVTELVNGSVYWVYGFIAKYIIVTNDQTYYLESFSNNGYGFITGNDINNSDVRIDDLTAITAVTIGPSVTEIGNSAFYECSNLASLTIGNSVETIGSSVFSSCSSLVSLIIPDSVEIIGNAAFSSCSSLVSLLSLIHISEPTRPY